MANRNRNRSDQFDDRSEPHDNRYGSPFDDQPEQYQSRYSEEGRDYGQMGDIRQDDPESYDRYQRGYERDDYRAGRERDHDGRERTYSGTQSDGGYGPARPMNRSRRGFGSFTGSDYGGQDFAGPRRTFAPGMVPSATYGAFGAEDLGAAAFGAGQGGRYRYSDDDRHERGFFEKAGDEVFSWFGDEDAARRREMDHRGRGPANYNRSDERILEDACDRLTEDRGVDARNVQVTVQDGEITLDGTVSSRFQKRRAEDCVDRLSGVGHVQNNLRIEQAGDSNRGQGERTSGTLA